MSADDYTETEKLRLLHAVFPDEYDDPDGPFCQIETTDDGHRICVAGTEHTNPPPRCTLCGEGVMDVLRFVCDGCRERLEVTP